MYTLVNYIVCRSPGCSDPLEFYRPEIDEKEESTQEVTAPEVEFVEAEEVFTAPAEVAEAIMATPKKRRKKVNCYDNAAHKRTQKHTVISL